MNDGLKYPILFDLEKGVETAIKDWDGKYAAKLEKAIQKRAFDVKLKIDTKAFDNLDDVKRRLADLRITPLNTENKTAIRDLTHELRELARIMEKIQKFRGIELPELQEAKAAKMRKEMEQADEKLRLSRERVRQADERLLLSQQKSAEQAKRTTTEYRAQNSYLKNLLKKTVALFGLQQVKTFLVSVRKVTAEFELQRVSLGAIIQDQHRANALFSEIKSFALKSPVSILDLTKYTKQLAAYKIGVDELFETTKRLADVSVGLGVSMDRVVLAYGQTRATGHLRASEIRQFTEMGVPIVEELAAKLSKMNGELVTSAQVMDLVSKRAVPFELVKEVFDDMTSAGGMFYNLQEKQGNTLFGLWAKLGDAASVMYDQIGNTESINSGMKMGFQAIAELMRNWKTLSMTLAIDAAAAGVFLLGKAALNKGIAISEAKVAEATRNRVAAQAELNVQLKIGTQADIAAAQAALNKAKADEQAAIAANKNASAAIKVGMGLVSIAKSVLKGLGIGLVIGLVNHLVYSLMEAWENSTRLKNALSDITTETGYEIARQVTNFESLAKKAIDAADGSREQKIALEELQRTYRNIIPEQDLTIEKLREMKGEYTNLTEAIREHITQQQWKKGLDAIGEEYSRKIVDEERSLKSKLGKYKFSRMDGTVFMLGDAQIDRIVDGFKRLVAEGKSAKDALKEAFELEDLAEYIGNYRYFAESLGLITAVGVKETYNFQSGLTSVQYSPVVPVESAAGLTEQIIGQTNAIKDWGKQMNSTVRGLGNFTTFLDEAKKSVSEYNFSAQEYTFAFDVENAKVQIDAYLKALQDAITYANVDIDLSKYITIDSKGIKRFDFSSFNEVLQGVDSKYKGRLIKMSGTVQNIYNGFIPSDRTVESLQNKLEQLAGQTGASMEKMRNYLMKNGEEWADYSTRIGDAIKSYKDRLEQMRKNNMAVASGENFVLRPYSDEEIKNTTTELNTLIALLGYLKTSESGSGGGSDPRLGILQEMAGTLKKINREYDELTKKEGAANALADVQDKYAATFKYLQSLSSKYKFNLPDFKVPADTASLSKYLNAVKEAMKKLPKSEKAVLSLETEVSDIKLDDMQKKIGKELEELADRISRSKTAKEFYEKILSTTGDIEFAAKVSMSIYGDDGFGLQKRLADQVRKYFQNDKINVDIPIDVIGKNNRINYKRLGEFAEQMKGTLGEEPYKAIMDIAEKGQQNMAEVWENYFKDIEKAESYASKRIRLAQATADKITAIRADMEANPELEAAGKSLIAGLIGKEMKEAAELEWEAFKGSSLYVQMFEDLEHASISTLEMMKSRLETLSGTLGSSLDPTQLKEMQSRMNEIDTQLTKRNPWKTLKTAYEQYREATASVSLAGATANVETAKKNLETVPQDSLQATEAQRELDARKRILDIVRAITKEQDSQVDGQKALTLAQQKAFDQAGTARRNLEKANAALITANRKATEEGKNPATDPGVIAAQNRVKSAEAEVVLTQTVSDILDDNAKKSNALKKGLVAAAQNVTQFLQIGSDIAAGIATTMEALGADEEDVQYFNDIAGAIGDITAGFQGLIDSALSMNVGGIISNAVGIIPNMVKGFAGLFSAGRVRRANKEIKRQQKLLDQLDYTYSRLEKAADKALGSDYINNFRQQEKVLQAQAEAYRKQYEAEKSKGKKSDEEKLKGFQDKYRDTMDAIADMEGQLAAQMLGSDLASAARNFAKAWLDAYKEFSSTADAMKGKFREMMENLIVESAITRVMERALEPMFKMIDNMGDKDFYSESFWKGVVETAEQGAQDADAGASLLMKFLEQSGMSIRSLGGEMTGISREIGSASEESINGLAVEMHTFNYYGSHIPKISENVVAMRQIMEGGNASLPAPAVDTTALWNQHLALQQGIYRHTSETLNECREITKQCISMAQDIHKVVVPRGSKGTHGVQVYM